MMEVNRHCDIFNAHPCLYVCGFVMVCYHHFSSATILNDNNGMVFCLQVEVTKFEELEETHAELKLKQTLWNSMVEWDVIHEEWMDVRKRYYVCQTTNYDIFVFSFWP